MDWLTALWLRPRRSAASAMEAASQTATKVSSARRSGRPVRRGLTADDLLSAMVSILGGLLKRRFNIDESKLVLKYCFI